MTSLNDVKVISKMADFSTLQLEIVQELTKKWQVLNKILNSSRRSFRRGEKKILADVVLQAYTLFQEFEI